MKTIAVLCTFLFLSQTLSAQSNDPAYLTILGWPGTFTQQFNPGIKERRRQIAFGIMLKTLITPVKELRIQVKQALDTAEQTGYPVLFQLDDWNYNPPSSDPNLVEWTTWPASGQSYGSLVKRRWINWGTWFWVEAPRNYESPVLRADVKQRLQRGVLPLITARLRKWNKEGRGYLFAGIVVGWESGYYTIKGTGVINLKPLPAYNGVTYGDSDEVNTGYAALTARGYTPDSVKQLAVKENKTEAQVIHDIMAVVVHDYSEFWANLCFKSGLPRERIYTHFTAVSSLLETESPVPFSDGRVLPLEAATNKYSRPGVTAADFVINLDTTSRAFHNLGYSDWGAVEIEFTDATRTENGAFQFLNRLADSGAKVICIFGWWEHKGHQFEANTPGAIKAMRKWLEQ
jgi:hypothetical protein